MSVKNADPVGQRGAPSLVSPDAGRTAVLIPGMHRSGTSALARVLNLLGCDISHSLLSANEFNERGYWEDPYFLDINERMLKSAGLSWNSWESLNEDWYASAKPSQFLKEASLLIDEKFGDSSLFVMKDPRIARLIPFWNRVMDEKGIAVKVVIPLRKPSEVAASLQHRDRMNVHQGQLLWLRYNLDAEFYSRGLDRAFLTYDQLLDDWRNATNGIRENLGGFSWPRQTASTFAEIDTFLSSDLRHHIEKKKQTVDDSPWARDVWSILLRWAQGTVKKGDDKRLDDIRSTMGQAESNFARVLIEHQKHGETVADALRAATEALDANLQSSDSLALSNQEREAALHAQLEQATLAAARLTATLVELEEVRAAKVALDTHVTEADARVAAAASELEAERLARAEQQDTLAGLMATLGELEALRAAQIALETQVGELEAERLAWTQQAESAVANQTAALNEIDELRAAKSAAEDQLAALDALVSTASSELEAERRAWAEQQESAAARETAALSEINELRAAKSELEDQLAASDALASTASSELEAERHAWAEQQESGLARETAAVGEIEELRATKSALEDRLAALEGLSSTLTAELDGERLARLEQEKLHARRTSDHAQAFGLMRTELAILRDDAMSDAEETRRLSLLVADQEEQIARLKVWLSASQNNSDHYQKSGAKVDVGQS